MQFKNLLVLASLAVASYAQTTPGQVENDINQKVAPALTALATAIDAFPVNGGPIDTVLPLALAIHTNSVNLDNTLIETTNDVKGAACPFGASDAQAILDDIKALLPTTQKSLTDIVARKAAFDAMSLGGVPALVKEDLSFLKQDTDALSSAFIACAPTDVANAAKELQTEIDKAFDPAIAAFD